jgi:hypothetical protein
MSLARGGLATIPMTRRMGTAHVPNSTNEVEEIRRQMAELRLDLHRDVRSVRAGTEAATNWRYYVKHYPWPCLAAAVAVGYFIVPRRPAPVKVVTRPAAEAGEDQVERKAKKAGLAAMAFGFLGPIALRAAQNYAINRLNTWMTEQGISLLDTPGPAVGPQPSPQPSSAPTRPRTP